MATDTTQEEQVEATPAPVLSDEEVTAFFEKHATSERQLTQMAQEVMNPIEFARVLGVRPQMIYNYIRKGTITAVRQNNTQKLFISLPECRAFAAKYLGRKSAKAQQVLNELNQGKSVDA